MHCDAKQQPLHEINVPIQIPYNKASGLSRIVIRGEVNGVNGQESTVA
jgi:hypothetical protein